MRSDWRFLRAACVVVAAIFPAYGQFFQEGGPVVGAGSVTALSEPPKVALSADGNTAALGFVGDGNDLGAAWVFARSSAGWSQQGNKLVPNDASAVGTVLFGTSLSLSSDGNTLLVGGPQDQNPSGLGAAWVFTRSNGVWSQQGAKLTGSGSSGTAFQGSSVALSADGSTALIGGYWDNGTTGATWVFTRSGSTWAQQGSKLVGSGGTYAEQGWAVAVSADGNTALIGGFGDNGSVGAAWIFTRSGSTWTQQGAKLVGTGAVGRASEGQSVALSADGATALLGAPQDNNQIGAVWVFTLSGGIWSQQGNKLVGSGYSAQTEEGFGTALSADGNTALIGGPGDNSVGAAWVFTRLGGIWTQQGGRLVGSGLFYPPLCASVALSAAGDIAIVGGDSNTIAPAFWVFAVPTLSVSTPASAKPGAPFNITVTALDSAGAVVTGYTDQVHFTSTDGSATLPADATLTNGTGQFLVTLLTDGNQTITATDTVYPTITATSGPVNVVVEPPSLAVSFGAAGIPVNGVTSLTYAITNPAVNSVALTGVAFTDYFPPNLFVASPNRLSNTCGGTATAVAGSGSVSLSGASIAPGSSCTLTVNITVTAATLYTSNPTTVVSANGGTGNTTSARLTVLVPITLNTVPAGLAVLVDGTSYTGGQSLPFAVYGSHTISAVTPQPGTPGTRYVFNNWSDGGAVSHTIYVSVTPTTYTATYTTQYQLALAVTPKGSGTVMPASGGFYDAGASVTLTAVANAEYLFNAWTGGANPPGSATATVVMSGPERVTASFQPVRPPPPPITSVLNSASFQQGQAAPYTILSLFGANLSCTPAPQVLVNGVQAQVLFSSNTQINFVIPAGLGSAGNTGLQVVCNSVSSPPVILALAPVNPAIFTLTQSGAGQGAVLNLNYTVNGAQSPASLGGYVFVYVTGFGELGPAGTDGLRRLTLPVTASVGGVEAQVAYAGEAPGYTSGLQQINVLIPGNAPAGPGVPIQLVVDGVSTQSGVTVAIQ